MDTFGDHTLGRSGCAVKRRFGHPASNVPPAPYMPMSPLRTHAMRASFAPFLLLTAFMPLAAGAALTRVEGVAVSPKEGRPLYRETHYLQDVDGRQARLVLYRCTDGRAFARKWMPPATDAQAPDFDFVDGRDGRRESVQRQGSKRVVSIRSATAAAEQGKALEMPAGGVIDAGFDAAVRAHWSTLLKGDTVSLPFLLTSRQRWVPVTLRRVAAIDWQGQPAEKLQMQLDAWFGFAVPAVSLVYAREGRRLLEFEGTGNVRDANGAWPQVRVRFKDPPQATDDNVLAQARAQPLVASCTG